jgi:hypothetical protein
VAKHHAEANSRFPLRGRLTLGLFQLRKTCI